MMQEEKNKYLRQAQEHVQYIQKRITETVLKREKQSEVMAQNARSLPAGDQIAHYALMAYNQESVENLHQLYPSPYFTRCDFETNGEKKTLYFAKFSFSDENILSWITPAAALRFENLGSASYTRTDGSKRSGVLSKKDQYMIVNGKIIFLSTEGIDNPRELVYQEHFTRHKRGFILPEVVEIMEKAQDQVIRAHYQGPFVISGPAGSGKTTLALHRVAYLIQSPETAEHFTPDSILVLVQDAGTREYFSHLLPELGIRGVSIITFAEWAMSVLRLDDYEYMPNFGGLMKQKELYEYAKLTALNDLSNVDYDKNIYSVLATVYEKYLNDEQKKMLARQKKERLLDRFDFTVLLSCYYKTFGKLTLRKEYYQELANGNYKKKSGNFPAVYNLMIVDEFQNYFPEQLRLLKACLNPRLDSVVYVGDIAQQTQLGTLKKWEDIGEKFDSERVISLQKVYRNTKQILNFIKQLGFNVAVPEGLKEGKPVTELATLPKNREIEYINDLLKGVGAESSVTIGVLAKEKQYLEDFKKVFGLHRNILCLTMQEAQGVEFDIVCLVGINDKTFALEGLPAIIAAEVKKIQRDLLYVALTRAMSELHVLGKIII